MIIFKRILLLLGLISMVSLAACGSSQSDLSQQDKIERLLEGTYELSGWNDGDDQYAPPTVKGRITFYDGTVVFILHNNIDAEKQTTLAWMGEYQLEGDTFGLRYINASTFKLENGTINETNQVPWTEFRKYEVAVLTDNMLKLETNGGTQVLEFSTDQLIYTDFAPANLGSGSGFANRIWNRISDKPQSVF
ncbi:hypothetical protein N8Z26_05435 [Burkholderiales bacterium]|nr:hypothetical protein [Burkholderiales bacterium]